MTDLHVKGAYDTVSNAVDFSRFKKKPKRSDDDDTGRDIDYY